MAEEIITKTVENVEEDFVEDRLWQTKRIQ